MRLDRYFDVHINAARRFPDNLAFAGKRKGQWIKYTFSEYIKLADKLSLSLLEAGLKKGDKVINISQNKPEWFIIDLAVTQIGGLHIPVFPNFNESDFRFIIDQCEPFAVFTSGKLNHQIIETIKKQTGQIGQIYSVEDMESTASVWSLIELSDNKETECLQVLRDSVSAEDRYSIYYTSGTGGGPKGAVYTHGSVRMIEYIGDIFKFSPEDRSISYLPLSHAYERPHALTLLNSGAGIYFAENALSVMANLQEVQPTFMTTVPLLLERIYKNIENRGFSLPEDKRIPYQQALKTASEFKLEDENEPAITELRNGIFAKWRQIMGGSLRYIGSAGAPLPPHINRFFHAIGIPVVECYGLTECAMVGYNIPPDGLRIGSVGKAARDVDMKIADDGEILIKSPYVTREIYKIPVLNETSFTVDGYFKSGDIGTMDDEGFFYLTGRKKEIFKVKSGRYLAPATVEKQLLKSEMIQFAVIYAVDGMVRAVISPAPAALNAAPEEEDLNQLIRSEVEQCYNIAAVEHEKITDFTIDRSEWSISNGFLTPTMKVKRHKILERVAL